MSLFPFYLRPNGSTADIKHMERVNPLDQNRFINEIHDFKVSDLDFDNFKVTQGQI